MPPGLEILWLLVPVGAVAGFVAGLFGIGGGVVSVVVLVMLLPHVGVPDARVMHVALGSSLAAIVLTGLSSALAHHRRGAVNWPVVLRFAPAVAAGALLGGAVAQFIPDQALRIGFGCFLLIVAFRLWRPPVQEKQMPLPGTAVLAGVGAIIGVLSSWTGIGGGSLSGPYLMHRGLSARRSVATSAAVGVPLALAGTVGYVLSGLDDALLPSLTLGYLHWPSAAILGLTAMQVAPLGARFAHSLPEPVLKTLYAALLALAALKIMSGS